MKNLEFAINMELEGEQFYRSQAALHKGSGLEVVCLLLAEDEKRHADILKAKLDQTDWSFDDEHTLIKEAGIFHDIDDLRSEIRTIPTQKDFYMEAAKKEKQSIDLYKDCLAQAKNENDIDLFSYLINQEEHHFDMLDDLTGLLTHAEEWVEDAEFGLRKEEY